MRWWRSKLELAMRPVPVAAPRSQIAPELPNFKVLRSPQARNKAARRDQRPPRKRYLALSRLRAEVAHDPRLLPYFIRIVAMLPQTLAELARERRGIAA